MLLSRGAQRNSSLLLPPSSPGGKEIADPQGPSVDGQGRIDAARPRQDAAIGHIEVLEGVNPAVRPDHRRIWVVAGHQSAAGVGGALDGTLSDGGNMAEPQQVTLEHAAQALVLDPGLG